jgi:hypothetical protein
MEALPEFAKIAPYLKNPLVLVGFGLLLVFGFYRSLVRAGTAPATKRRTGRRDLHDIGPAVEASWCDREYEWDISIRAGDVPVYLALGGRPGDDLLKLPQMRFSEDEGCATKTFLEERGIPHEFWASRGLRLR